MCHAFICTYILLYTSRVRLCVSPDRLAAHTGRFCYLDYLAALDLLTRHGLPAYRAILLTLVLPL